MPRVAAKDRPAFLEERRTAILEAALRVWAKRGFDGTSVEEVAREAGLTKGTLYLYFPSKRALLEETLRRYSLRPDVEAGLASLRGQPLENVVRGLVAVFWRGLEARRELGGRAAARAAEPSGGGAPASSRRWCCRSTGCSPTTSPRCCRRSASRGSIPSSRRAACSAWW